MGLQKMPGLWELWGASATPGVASFVPGHCRWPLAVGPPLVLTFLPSPGCTWVGLFIAGSLHVASTPASLWFSDVLKTQLLAFGLWSTGLQMALPAARVGPHLFQSRPWFFTRSFHPFPGILFFQYWGMNSCSLH